MTCGKDHFLPLPVAGDASQTGKLADELALDIHLGRMRPGEPLREVELAAKNNVSRTIVRAALQRLEAQGLAQITLNKGARVRMVKAESLADMIDLHAGLLSLAARHAATRANSAHIARMRQFVEMLEHVAAERPSTEEFQHLRIGFIRAMQEAAGPVLAERLRTATPTVPHHDRALADIACTKGQTSAAALVRRLFNAIAARDEDAAAQAAELMMRRHGEAASAAAPVLLRSV